MSYIHFYVFTFDPKVMGPFLKIKAYTNFEWLGIFEKPFGYLESEFNSLLNESGIGWIAGKNYFQIFKSQRLYKQNFHKHQFFQQIMAF